MNATDTIAQLVPKSLNRPQYTVQNKGADDVKFTHEPAGTFADDDGIILMADEGYVFEGRSANQVMYVISDTGLTNRVLVMNPGTL